MSVLGKWLLPRGLFQKNAAIQDVQKDPSSAVPQPLFPGRAQSPAIAEATETPLTIEPEPISSSARSDLPLIRHDEGLLVRGPDGHYQPLRWHRDGPWVQSLLPGWQASWIFDDFLPVRLIELDGPRDHVATWFIDETGARLGDKVSELSGEHQLSLASGLTRLLSSRKSAATAADVRYDRICQMTRLQIEALLPNTTYDRAMELGQATAAAGGAIMREQARIDAPAIAMSQDRLASMLVDGWRTDDLDGGVVCIATGRRSLIRFLDVPTSSAYYIGLAIGSLRLSRRLRVAVNGRTIAINPLSGIFHRDGARFGYWVPPELVHAGTIEVTLEHEMISRASDEAFVLKEIRLDVGEPVEGRDEAAPSDAELMLRFQNLGDNCQFGFVQRYFGAEPMNLLRFAGVSDLTGLIASGLRGLGDPGTVGYFMKGSEYQILETRYSIFYHTFKYAEAVSPEQIIAENELKLRYLARKFIEDLEDAETIWISRRIVSNDINEILALQAALRRYGPNRLLWITPAPHDRDPGEIEWLGTDLLRGYLASDASNDPSTFNPDHYRLLCRNADQAFRSR